MRIVSYNILDGGQERLEHVKQVICAQSPDVVGLVEADDLSVVEQLAKFLQMDFVQASGGKHASALLSRYKIRESINFAPLRPALRNSFLQAAIVDAQGHAWTLGIVHLHPHATEEAEARRMEEIEAVLEAFAPCRAESRQHLIMGDFNANSPVQQIDPQRCTHSTREAFASNGGHIPRRVVQRIRELGYVDTLEALDPAGAATLTSFTTEHPGQRLDYIFMHGIERARIRRAWVHREEPANIASDHYPVGLELA